jgi:hypothetical protein
LFPICATGPIHLICHDFGEEYSLPHTPVTMSLLGPNIFLSALLSNTLSLCSY